MIYVRLKVVISLYLSPNNRARSLSTLMVAIVIRDPTQNAKRYADDVGCVICVSPKTPINIRQVAARGWATRPTNRSVVARQRCKSLDGEWREDSLWRERRMRTVEKEVNSWYRTSSWKLMLVCVSPVKLEFAIVNQRSSLFPPQFTREIFRLHSTCLATIT